MEARFRALRLSQIRSLHRHIRRRCEAERWCDGDGELLSPDAVTMYDAVAYVIKPATEARQCSLVEYVSDGPVRPAWFVSHHWGGTVSHLLACLETHARDRGLDANEATYWLAAASLSQWGVGGDWNMGGSVEDLLVREDARMATFALAMAASQGVVCVVDQGGAALGRSWVHLESHFAHELQEGAKFEVPAAPAGGGSDAKEAKDAKESGRGRRSSLQHVDKGPLAAPKQQKAPSAQKPAPPSSQPPSQPVPTHPEGAAQPRRRRHTHPRTRRRRASYTTSTQRPTGASRTRTARGSRSRAMRWAFSTASASTGPASARRRWG